MVYHLKKGKNASHKLYILQVFNNLTIRLIRLNTEQLNHLQSICTALKFIFAAQPNFKKNF